MDTPDIPAVHAFHLRTVSEARAALEHARDAGSPEDGTAAQRRLRGAIDAARDAGVTWMQIGTLFGIARGNAYQQYRRRPL